MPVADSKGGVEGIRPPFSGTFFYRLINNQPRLREFCRVFNFYATILTYKDFFARIHITVTHCLG